jgi:hypothetical protein
MDPSNEFALALSGILNANLYFFSWGGLVMSYLVLVSYLNECYIKNKNKNLLSFDNTSAWGWLCLTSFITMVSSVRLYTAIACHIHFAVSCPRAAWGISLGVLSGLLAVIPPICHAYMTSDHVPKYLEAIISVINVIMWTFGIAYLTFGTGPGTPMGNLYFFTWGSFLLAVYLVSNSLSPFLNASEQPNPNSESKEKNNETMDQEDNEERA